MDNNLRSVIRELEESVELWAPGKTNQKARERYVVEHFMLALGLPYAPPTLTQPDDDPPDVCVDGASFEIKEIQDRGRKRHDEYRQKLTKALQAEQFEDLMEPLIYENVPISRVFARVMEETRKLLTKYSADVRSRLDLLFYVNTDANKSWGIEDGVRPDVQPLRLEGWRSVSFLQGVTNCGVLVASAAAPEFLRVREGQLIRGSAVL